MKRFTPEEWGPKPLPAYVQRMIDNNEKPKQVKQYVCFELKGKKNESK